jgi:hypothetical protein
MYVHTRTILRSVTTLVSGPTASFLRFVVVTPFLFLFLLPYTFALTVFRALDHVFYGSFRKIEVKAPIFIVANPRSGTTLLHRLLSLDGDRFTALQLWQTLVPSVFLYRLVGLLSRIDRLFGRPLGRLMHWIERTAFGGWDGVHNMGLTATEEEEAYFFMMWASPSVWFTFPDKDRLAHVGVLDDMPAYVRHRVMRMHRTSIQRHLYATGSRAVFLSKNVMSTGRLHSLLEMYPDARFVYLVRNPDEAIPSFASMFSMPWRFLVPRMRGKDAKIWADLGVRFYLHAAAFGATMPPDRFVTVRYDDVVADPAGTVRELYKQLGLPLSDEFAATLARESERAARYERRHDYTFEEFGIDRQQLHHDLAEIYERHGFDRDASADDATLAS